MKFFIVFAVVVASAAAVPYGGVVNTGSSAVSRSEDGYGNYAFGYNEDHATGGTFRKEKGSHGVQVGSYGLRDADGRMRVVNYVADIHGFRASVSTNEPGTDVKQDPAATSLTYGGHGVPLAHAAPVLAAPLVHAAPLAHAAPMAYAGHGLGYAGHGYAGLGHAYGAPVATSYAVNTAHAAPLHAAPVAYAGHGYAGHGYAGLAGHGYGY